MEYWVDGVEALWETKCDGVGTWLHYDLIWSQKLISKLLRGTGRLVVWKNCALTKAQLLIRNSTARVQ